MATDSLNRFKKIVFYVSFVSLIAIILIIINYGIFGEALSAELTAFLEKWGYISAFILAFSIEIIPQPFISSLFVFATGYTLGLTFTKLLIVTMAGAILSNFVAYFLGIRFGVNLTKKIIGEESYENTHVMFKKYGNIGMTILALTPLPYFPILGGLFKMSFRDFLVYAIIPRLFHFAIFSYLIYYIL